MFEYGRGQAVRLPKRFRFIGKEVFVQRVGQAAVLLPKDAAWQTFLDGANGFTEDVFEDGREQGFSGNGLRTSSAFAPARIRRARHTTAAAPMRRRKAAAVPKRGYSRLCSRSARSTSRLRRRFSS